MDDLVESVKKCLYLTQSMRWVIGIVEGAWDLVSETLWLDPESVPFDFMSVGKLFNRKGHQFPHL